MITGHVWVHVLLFLLLSTRGHSQETCEPVDCIVSGWNNWSECTQTCGQNGTRLRIKTVFRVESCGGTCSEPVQDTELCNIKCCPKDCVYSDWTKWGLCFCDKKGCEGGAERYNCQRSRKKLNESECGGYCDEIAVQQQCGNLCCLENCILSAWSFWGHCQAQCEQPGTTSRVRTIVQEPRCHGKPCGALQGTKQCTGTCCPVDCVLGQWSAWSKCNVTCGESVQTRVRFVQLPDCKGEPCTEDTDERQTRPCSQYVNVDCLMSPWTPWSDCFLDNGFCGKGSRRRSRTIERPPECQGQSCGNVTESVQCYGPCCIQDCTVSEWTEWSHCSASCGQGISNRTRTITQTPSCGGSICPSSLLDKRDCAVRDVLDCDFTDWSAWTSCSTDCGVGVHGRTRTMITPAYCGGKCGNEAVEEDISCESYEAKQNCEVSQWSEWGRCVRNCANGDQTRNRTILVNPVCNGTACPLELVEHRDCHAPCGQLCNLGVCSCRLGYRLSTDNVTCSEIICPIPKLSYCPPSHRELFDCRQVYFRCKDGYKYNKTCTPYCSPSDWTLKGTPLMVTCQTDGTWTQPDIFCARPNKKPIGIEVETTVIEENKPKDFCFAYLTTITDNEEYEAHAYTIVSDVTNRFYIRDNRLCLARVTDYEEGPSKWNVTLRSTDIEGEYVEKPFTFEITNTNDPPTSVKIEPNTIPENSPPGTVVGCLSATDDDANQNVTLTLVDSFHQVFATFIDENTGKLCIKVIADSDPRCQTDGGTYCTLNKEVLDVHYITILAQDDGVPPMSAYYDIPIRLTDVNDRQTSIVIGQEPKLIPEEVDAGMPLVRLVTIDEDMDQTYTYTLLDDNGGLFNIVGDNLAATRVFDYEAEKGEVFEVLVESTDDDQVNPLKISKTIIMQIADVNESPYDLQLSSSNGILQFELNQPKIRENINAGVIGTVSVKDPDVADDVHVQFVDGMDADGRLTLVNKRCSSLAKVNVYCSVSLILSDSLNHEVESHVNISISASDHAGKTTFLNVSIEVIDMNDPPTKLLFDGQEKESISVEEDRQDIKISTLSAVDEDAISVHTFELVDSAAGLFTIENDDLMTSKDSVLDYETQSQHTIRVKCTDNGDPSLTTLFLIEILVSDVNETPTLTTLSNNKVKENSPDGTIVGELTTIDPDNEAEQRQTFRYSLPDDSEGRFKLNGNKLVVRSSSRLCGNKPCALDYEVEPRLFVTVLTMDDGTPRLHREDTFVIELENVNDPPTDIKLTNSVVNENKPVGAVIGTLIAFDQDGVETLGFALKSHQDIFGLSEGDKLVTKTVFDYEYLRSYRLLISVVDNGDPPAESEETIVIHILDINEVPTFTNVSDDISVREDVLTNSPAATLALSDPDSRDTIVVSVNDASDTFNIDDPICDTTSATGATDCTVNLIVNRPLDFNVMTTYNLELTVQDAKGLTSRHQVTVNVVDVNNTPTNILIDNLDTSTLHVPEDTGISNIVKLEAVDSDVDQTCTYAITDDSSGILLISGNILQSTSSLDFESNTSNITLTVQVQDSGTPSLSFTKTFVIVVDDVNEAPTNLNLSNYEVNENSREGTVIGTFKVKDPDNNNQTFHIALLNSYNGLYVVDNDILKVGTDGCTENDQSTCRLDYENENTHALTAIVKDDGVPQRTALFNVVIAIKDVNEAPKDIQLYDNKVVQGAAAGSIVGNLTAIDEDMNQTYLFELVDNTDKFEMDPPNTLLIKDGSLLQEGELVYVTVKVTDDGTPASSSIGTVHVIVTGDDNVTMALTSDGTGQSFITNQVTIAENINIGNMAATITVDIPETNRVFTTTLVNGSQYFTVGNIDCVSDDEHSTCSGDLLIKSLLDYEKIQYIDVIIKATAEDGKEYLENFRIAITDENESPTDIVFGDTSIVVIENSVNEFVGAFNAKDQDVADTHTFVLQGTDQLVLSSDGTLSSADNATLDFEATPDIEIVVIVTDAGGLSVNKTLIVNVVDENEKPVRLNISNNKIAEMSVVGTPVGTLLVDDPDRDQLFTFTILNGGDGLFSISDSVLKVAIEGQNCSKLGNAYCALDYETKSAYTLSLKVTDNGNPPLSEIFKVDVIIEDVNDKPTSIRINSTKVDENIPPGSVVGDFSSTDRDEGQTLTFEFSSPDDMFYIKNNSLIVNGSLDFETQPTYSLQVVVSDDGIPSLSVTATIVIEVIDVNEPPNALTLVHTADSGISFIDDEPQLEENMPPSTFIGQIIGFDPDTSEDITLQMISPDLMTLNKECIPLSKGTRCAWDVSSTRSFDFEKENNISFVVMATDRGGHQILKNFTIFVVDANDSPTDIFVTTNGDLVNSIRVFENSVGIVVAELSTVDEETNQTYIYDVIDSTKSLFVSNNELRITSAANLDFERLEQFSITVKVTDSGAPPLSFEKQFTVHMEDVNEAPTSISLTENEVLENATKGTQVGSIIVQDPDNIRREIQQFTLAITDVGSHFGLEGDTLIVTKPGFEQATYVIGVNVTDNGTPPLTTQLQLNVRILIMNRPPVRLDFTGSSVKEDIEIGSVVGQLKGRDDDVGQTLMYRIVNSDVLSTRDSAVIVNGLFDYETGVDVVFTASVTDNGDPPLTLERNFTLTVEDVNERPLTLKFIGNRNMNISEGLGVGEPVGVVEVRDEDKTEIFEGMLSDGSDVFKLSPAGFKCERSATGIPMTVCTVDLLLASQLDYESTHEKVCTTISVRDKGGLELTELFTFTVTNENEPPRDILLDTELSSIPENTDDVVVGGLSTIDDDLTDTHLYQVITSWDIFTVVGNKLFVRAPLDYEQQSSYVVGIRTSDRGTPPLSLTKTFVLNVTNENEAPSDITLSHNEVEGGAVGGTIVCHVTVVDPDNIGGRATPQTHTCKLSPGELFMVDSENIVKVRETIPFDIILVNISITCSDSGTPSLSYSKEFSIKVVENVDAPKSIKLISESDGEHIEVDENVADFTLGTLAVINSLTGINDAGSFLFVVENGEELGVTVVDSELKLIEAADYESNHTLKITILAEGVDAGGRQLSLKKDFKVTVNDVNEAPSDVGVYGDSTIEENYPTGSVIGDLYTIDPEDDQTYTYQIIAVNYGLAISSKHSDLLNVFDIEGKTLKVGSHEDGLNYEVSDVMTLRIQSTDSGSPPYSVQVDIHLQITDVNDPPTDITISNNMVSEDSPSGTVIGTLIVDDEDVDDPHQCKILNIIDVPFKVVNNTEVIVDQKLDYESTKSYNIKVSCGDLAADGSGMKLSKTLNVNISNVNEPPTDIQLTMVEVKEANVIGQVIGEIKAVDLDSSKTVVALSNEGDWEDFGIDGDSTLVAQVVFDYEVRSYYTLTITATDEEGLTMSKRFEIQILDINEPPSTILIDTQEVSESKVPGESIGKFTTVDSDRNQKFVYSLDGDIANTGIFEIQDSSLTVGPTGLDYEKQHQHVISVTSTDNGTPPHSVMVNFTIEVLDINEPPSDIVMTMIEDIPEDTPTHTIVARVRVDDADVDQSHSCQLNDSTHLTLMTNDPGEIELILLQSVDFEKASIMYLKITCTDGEFEISKVLTINVIDVNEAPTSIKLSGSKTIRASADSGHVVGQLTVDDDDTYQMHIFTVAGQNSDLITVSNSNELMLKSAIPVSQIEQLHPSLKFVLIVADNGNPVLKYNQTFVIPITNIDIIGFEIPKVGIDDNNITENSKAGTVIGKLFYIVDEDRDRNMENLYMSIEENFQNMFKIENGTYLVLARDFSNTDLSTIDIVVKVIDAKSQDSSLNKITLFIQKTCASDQFVCNENEKCVMFNDTYSECACQDDFQRNSNDVCDAIDDCVTGNTENSVPCLNGGTCIDDVNSFVCKCLVDFGGDRCEINNKIENPCTNHGCENSAICVPDIDQGTYTCSCKTGWMGDRCDINNDDCTNAICYNDGTCIDKQLTYLCNCPLGFKGLRCEYGQDICSDTRCNTTHVCVGLALSGDTLCVPDMDYTITLVYDRPKDVEDMDVFLARLVDFIIVSGRLPTLTAPSIRRKRAVAIRKAQVYVVEAIELDTDQYEFDMVILNEDGEPFTKDAALSVLSITCAAINYGELSERTFCPAIIEAARKPPTPEESSSSVGLIVGLIIAVFVIAVLVTVAIILYKKKKDNSVSPEVIETVPDSRRSSGYSSLTKVGRPLPSPKMSHNKVAPYPLDDAPTSSASELHSLH